LRAETARAAKAWLREVEAPFLGKTLHLHGLVPEGTPASEIVKSIERYHIDLAVLGTRGLSGLTRFLLGSVSEQALLHAPCSVMVVRGRGQSGGSRRSGPLRILLAVDASPDAAAAERLLGELGMPKSAKVTLLHVVEKADHVTSRLFASGRADLAQLANDVLQARKEAAQRLLDQVQKRLRSTGFSADAVLAEGHPAPQIIRAAQQRRVDLVVLGSRGMTGVKRFLVGSVSRKVARHAPCSVLVVRPKR
jgi:nucleotide-binding universal stress UspA family protein